MKRPGLRGPLDSRCATREPRTSAARRRDRPRRVPRRSLPARQRFTWMALQVGSIRLQPFRVPSLRARFCFFVKHRTEERHDVVVEVRAFRALRRWLLLRRGRLLLCGGRLRLRRRLRFSGGCRFSRRLRRSLFAAGSRVKRPPFPAAAAPSLACGELQPGQCCSNHAGTETGPCSIHSWPASGLMSVATGMPMVASSSR